jgi:hypothetical protein
MNISQQDAIWLVEDYNRIRNYGKVNSWIDYHVKAQQLIKGQAEKPSCSCSWGATARIASSLYEQHENEIKAIAYPPQIEVIDETPIHSTAKKRGRRTSETNTEESKEL